MARDKLQRAILALVQPAEVQLSLFPDFVSKADELALNFEDGLYELVGHEDEITAEQSTAIDALDEVISSMSGPTGLWTEEALATHPTWERVRDLAKAVAAAFEWKLRIPPHSGAIYIPASA